MSDDRPSIAELQQIELEMTALEERGLGSGLLSPRILDASPVLLEIVAAALRYRAGMSRSEVDTTRCEALDRALCKVHDDAP